MELAITIGAKGRVSIHQQTLGPRTRYIAAIFMISLNCMIQGYMQAYFLVIDSLNVTEVWDEALNTQVYIPPSAVWKGEKLRMVSGSLVITNTLDMVSVLDMMFASFCHIARMLQERINCEPTVAW